MRGPKLTDMMRVLSSYAQESHVNERGVSESQLISILVGTVCKIFDKIFGNSEIKYFLEMYVVW